MYHACPDIAGVLELKEETIESLLAAACLLQLSQVIQVCCNFLMKQLHPSNCLGIRSFADAQGCVDLLNVAHNYTMVGRQIELDHVYMAGWAKLLLLLYYLGLYTQSESSLPKYTRATVLMKAVTLTGVFKTFCLIITICNFTLKAAHGVVDQINSAPHNLKYNTDRIYTDFLIFLAHFGFLFFSHELWSYSVK